MKLNKFLTLTLPLVVLSITAFSGCGGSDNTKTQSVLQPTTQPMPEPTLKPTLEPTVLAYPLNNLNFSISNANELPDVNTISIINSNDPTYNYYCTITSASSAADGYILAFTIPASNPADGTPYQTLLNAHGTFTVWINNSVNVGTFTIG